MSELKKKPRRSLPKWVIAAALAVLILAAAAWLLFRQDDLPEPVSARTYEELTVHETAEVTQITITLRSGETFTLARSGDGWLMNGSEDAALSADRAEELAQAMAVISYDAIIAEETDDWQANMDDFGLNDPRVTAEAVYSDGTSVTLHVGSRSAMDGDTWSYMMIEGDGRLYALDRGTADTLTTEASRLYSVNQPELHKQRISRITIAEADGSVCAWELEGDITDSAALWHLTQPVRYPVDAAAMDGLLSNLANLRFGARVAEATEENLAVYGFDEPRLVMTIHQSAGTTNETDESGAISCREWPDSDFTLVIGGEKSELVDYVMADGVIMTASHFTMAVFLELDPYSTVSHYAAHVPLSTLASLAVCHDGMTDVYVLIQDEETNGEGQTVSVTRCKKNGSSFSYEAFEAAYARLENVTMTGRLPEGWSSDKTPELRYLFTDTAGVEHHIETVPFDALHDAVLLDGVALFYLIHGGMTWQAE